MIDNIDWLPTKLLDKVKIIITVTSNISNIDECQSSDLILSNLKHKIAKTNFVHLNQLSDQQWREVLTLGGGDINSTNGQLLHLPDAWRSCPEKIPLKAKVTCIFKLRMKYKFVFYLNRLDCGFIYSVYMRMCNYVFIYLLLSIFLLNF